MKAYLKTHEWIEATNEESYELGISGLFVDWQAQR